MTDNDDLDGCELEFDPTDDKETQKLLIPKGEEHKAWTEQQERERVKVNGA